MSLSRRLHQRLACCTKKQVWFGLGIVGCLFVLFASHNRNATSIIHTSDSFLEQHSCELPLSSNFSDFLIPMERHGHQSFILPTPQKRQILSKRDLADNTTFVFIHVNKAGGTLIKEQVFKPVALQNSWSGAGYGSGIGWKQLLRSCESPSQGPFPPDEALSCGHSAPLSPCGPSGSKACPLRLLWGSHAMGFCSLVPHQPCVMLIILREPVERMISQYNYVCVDAKEDKKKWLPAWKKAGRCPLSLLQFVDSNLTSKTFLVDHLTRAGDRECGFDLAVENLTRPCFRFLLLENLFDGLLKLAETWGPAIEPHLRAIARSHTKRNHAPYHPRVTAQIENKAIMAQLHEKLKLDIAFFKKAVSMYEQQWMAPIESCNS